MVEHIIFPTAIITASSRSLHVFCTFLCANGTISAPGTMNSYSKYLLDVGLVVLIIALIRTGVRSRTNNRNDDRPD